jgi:hypothetical protein
MTVVQEQSFESILIYLVLSFAVLFAQPRGIDQRTSRHRLALCGVQVLQLSCECKMRVTRPSCVFVEYAERSVLNAVYCLADVVELTRRKRDTATRRDAIHSSSSEASRQTEHNFKPVGSANGSSSRVQTCLGIEGC